MRASQELKMLGRLSMRLASMGQHRVALTLLALALRQSLRSRAVMQEARIRNNMALILLMAGRDYLARRQIVRAMGLVATRVGVDNRFYRTLQQNLARTLRKELETYEIAA